MKFHYDVSGTDFSAAGTASSDIKRKLKQLGLPPHIIKKTSVAMYEAEINMIIHAGGGVADINIGEDEITITMQDHGPGIPDLDKAMQEGFSTAPQVIQGLGFGAGMGLPNMKRNTDFMTIDTQVGKGTTGIMKIKLNGEFV